MLIINDLKRFGYSNEQIKYILAQICEDSCSVFVRNKKFNYKYFDFYASTFYKTGINFLIMIDNDCNAFYLTENKTGEVTATKQEKNLLIELL